MSGKIKLKEVDHICVIVDDIEDHVKKVEQFFDTPSIKWDEVSTTAMLKGNGVNVPQITILIFKGARKKNYKLLVLIYANARDIKVSRLFYRILN